MDTVATIITILMMASLYFAPTIVAVLRHHHNKWAIFALDLLLGWTFFGWIGALVWSLTNPSPPQPAVVHVHHDSQTA